MKRSIFIGLLAVEACICVLIQLLQTSIAGVFSAVKVKGNNIMTQLRRICMI